MYRDIPVELLRLIEPVVQSHGLELVDATVGRGPGRARVRVVLDTRAGDGAVLVDQCAAVSRELGHCLDARDLIPGPYLLEVTSPGVDRVLAREKDFERAIGRRVAIETRQPLERRRHFKGRLLAFDGARAHVETTAGPYAIPFELIGKATAFSASGIGTGGKR
jgi:ribosome maturation factor RimP